MPQLCDQPSGLVRMRRQRKVGPAEIEVPVLLVSEVIVRRLTFV
jgi:hypothetical protein